MWSRELEADLTLTVTVGRLGACWLTVMRFGGLEEVTSQVKAKALRAKAAAGFCSNRAPHKLKGWVEVPILMFINQCNP